MRVPLSSTENWVQMPPGQHAFIIRLDSLTEQGRDEGKSLEFVAAGGELPTWVQSQTNYVQMQRLGDGTWSGRQVLQKLWVNGESYEMQVGGRTPSIFSFQKHFQPSPTEASCFCAACSSCRGVCNPIALGA